MWEWKKVLESFGHHLNIKNMKYLGSEDDTSTIQIEGKVLIRLLFSILDHIFKMIEARVLRLKAGNRQLGPNVKFLLSNQNSYIPSDTYPDVTSLP